MVQKKKAVKSMTIDGVEYIRKSDIPKPALIAKVKSVQKHPYVIGEQWFIQTATLYYVGTLTGVTEGELIIEDSAWVADTGRFNEFMSGKQAAEMEPCGSVVINRGAIISAMPRQKTIIEVK